MIIPDANLLIFAHDETALLHLRAREWWEAALSGPEPVGLPWVVLLAFMRIMTHPQICNHPLSVQEARSVVESWLSNPGVRILQLSEQAPSVFFDLLEQAGMGGNISTDALIALHAREYSATIYSNDRDFGRFSGIRWIDPLR